MGFSIVGIVSTLSSIILLFVANEVFHCNQYFSYFFSYFLSILVSYYLNAHVVWKTRIDINGAVKYFSVYVSSMILGLIVLRMLNLIFIDANHTILGLFTMPVTMAWNYLFVNRILTNKH